MPNPGDAGRKEIASEESKQRNKDYEREFKEKLKLPTIEKDRNAILQQNNGRKIIGGKNGNNIKNPPDPKEIDIYQVSAPNQNYPDTKPRAAMWEAPPGGPQPDQYGRPVGALSANQAGAAAGAPGEPGPPARALIPNLRSTGGLAHEQFPKPL